jgi:hypothetical protein
MRGRQTILVFPGGAREVNERKDEKYPMIWKVRLGKSSVRSRTGSRSCTTSATATRTAASPGACAAGPATGRRRHACR